LQTGIETLAELQDVLYAQDRWSLLLIFQAMDAAGKDGTIRAVMTGINPLEVVSAVVSLPGRVQAQLHAWRMAHATEREQLSLEAQRIEKQRRKLERTLVHPTGVVAVAVGRGADNRIRARRMW